MRKVVYAALAVLTVVHQDFWLWDDPTLVFGFLPIGMAYHMGYSLAAAGVWFLATKFAWPEETERFAEGSADREDHTG
jgi:hypothetical protein